MNRLHFHCWWLLLLYSLWGCKQPTPSDKADLILTNGQVYTLQAAQPWAQAIAIKGANILAVGDSATILSYATDSTRIVDLRGQFVMPGFIEGHGHFSALGNSLMNLNFLQARSWGEIVDMVAQRAQRAQPGEWISGRGWHQEKWLQPPTPQVGGYPLHHSLSARTPYNPVILRHASGHSLFANEAAMQAAGVTKETPDPKGGRIVRDAQGNPIGVFEERAMELITQAYQQYLTTLPKEKRLQQWYEGIERAQQICLRKGVTSFQDAGSSFEEIARYRQMAAQGKLQVRLWAMLRHSCKELQGQLDEFPIIDEGEGFFTCRAIKSELDGALGSYGAWLLEPYHDKPGFSGQNTTPIEEVACIAQLCAEHQMQLCVHAIGDRANRVWLDLCEEIFKAHPEETDWRWRSEHAQHLHPDDIPRFAQLGVIASMQAIHCTSDAPFVVKRLGQWRAQTGAYAWRALLDAGAVVTNGTDTPVEDVDPIASFYASVTRRRPDNGMVFFAEQVMSRQEAIYAYTMANAYAAFEEDKKGSLEPGKYADLVVLSQNLLHCPTDSILHTRVLMTIVGGQIKYTQMPEG